MCVAGFAPADDKPASVPLVLVFEPAVPAPPAGKAPVEWKQDEMMDVVRVRMKAFKIKATVEPRGKDRLAVALADPAQKAKALDLLRQAGQLGFHLVHPDTRMWVEDVNPSETPPDGYRVLPVLQRKISDNVLREDKILVQGEPELPRNILKKALPGTYPNNEWRVLIDLTKEGGEGFRKLTEANIGKRLAVVLDDTVLWAPMIREAITQGQLEISAMGDETAVRELCCLLNNPLPVPLRFVEEPPKAETPAPK